jgi:hypothetical protein
MAKSKNISEEIRFWLPINLWNLNELFATESISPISFYEERNFGNPVNRNEEAIEDKNKLILFDQAVQSPILLKISSILFDVNYLTEIKTSKKIGLKIFEYSKTIYLKKGYFNVCFSSELKLNEFLNNTFMLLEVKAINKFKSDFIVIQKLPGKKAFYQTQLISSKTSFQPFFDRAFNQIKGLIFGCVIGSIGTLDEKEQNLISELLKLKNSIGSIHTDIALSEEYSAFWLITIRKQIIDCQKSYIQNFNAKSDVFDTILLRLEEIDSLNNRRCVELSKQKKSTYKRDYEKEQEVLELKKRELHQYEYENGMTSLIEEFEIIKQAERRKGELKGKTREYFKIGTEEYDRKQELKHLITKLEENVKYQILKREVNQQEERLRDFQFGFTQFDTSITEQFSRISEYLHEINKEITNYFLSKNNKSNNFPDISFEFDLKKLADHYFNYSKSYTDFSVVFPTSLSKSINESELQLLCIAVNSILSKPQGRLGNFSEQNILEIIKDIGEHLPENSHKETLREYYKYRIGRSDSFIFPNNSVMVSIIIFLMKLNGHDQINKMLVAKKIHN